MTIFYDNWLFAGYPRTCKQGGAAAVGEEKVIFDCFGVTRIFTMINDVMLKMLRDLWDDKDNQYVTKKVKMNVAGAQVGGSQATTSIQPPGE